MAPKKSTGSGDGGKSAGQTSSSDTKHADTTAVKGGSAGAATKKQAAGFAEETLSAHKPTDERESSNTTTVKQAESADETVFAQKPTTESQPADQTTLKHDSAGEGTKKQATKSVEETTSTQKPTDELEPAHQTISKQEPAVEASDNALGNPIQDESSAHGKLIEQFPEAKTSSGAPSDTDTRSTLPSANGSHRTSSEHLLDRWPGWVPILSEPAHFNTLLREFGTKGVKIQEVFGLRMADLEPLPRPVYALIFLYRWKDSGRNEPNAAAPEGVWFARQVAENACATNALLNIVNNIPDIDLGTELQAFRDRTNELSPYERGVQVKSFNFVRKIHNSFATEADIRDADQYLQQVVAEQRRAAAVKARKDAQSSRQPVHTSKATSAAPARASSRLQSAAIKQTPTPAKSSGQSEPTSSMPSQNAKSTPPSTLSKRRSSPEGIDGAPTKKAKHAHELEPPPLLPDNASSDKSDKAVGGTKNACRPYGRGSKQPSPRRAQAQGGTQQATESLSNAAHHFVAFMPIREALWKLDGLEATPELLADLDPNRVDDWLEQATLFMRNFTSTYDDGIHEFNVMAVIHDPLLLSKNTLCENIKSIQAVEGKLASIVKDWEEAQAEDDKPVDLIRGIDVAHDISQQDIDNADLPASFNQKLEDIKDIAALLEMRKGLATRQTVARAGFREELSKTLRDKETSYQYRHSYDL